jgi:hypothetical protein
LHYAEFRETLEEFGWLSIEDLVMATLTLPEAKFHQSWLEAALEFDGVHRDGASGEDWPLESLREPGHFAPFADELVADTLPESPRKDGYVPCTFFEWSLTATPCWGPWPYAMNSTTTYLTRVVILTTASGPPRGAAATAPKH